MGFRDQLNSILEYLPPSRQTMLFSATQTKSIKDLARLSLKKVKPSTKHLLVFLAQTQNETQRESTTAVSTWVPVNVVGLLIVQRAFC